MIFFFFQIKEREDIYHGQATVGTSIHNDKLLLTKNEFEQSSVKMFRQLENKLELRVFCSLKFLRNFMVSKKFYWNMQIRKMS